MSDILYVISHGPGYEYSVEGLLLAEPGKDLEALWVAFCEAFRIDRYGNTYLNNFHTHDDLEYNRELVHVFKASNKLGLSRDEETPRGCRRVYASTIECFVEWLVQCHGFRRIETVEMNL